MPPEFLQEHAKRILVVEDEPHIAQALQLNLEMEDYHVTVAKDGLYGWNAFASARYDLAILDVMLPRMDGLALCAKIRFENADMPILILSAKGNTHDRVQGLKAGATDYLPKPFDLEEFLLKVKILLSATPSVPTVAHTTFAFDDVVLDFKALQATKGAQTEPLTKLEASLLRLLIEKQGQVVSRDEIYERVWGYDVYPSSRTIDNFILQFRKRFERDPRAPRHFIAVRGVGYMFQNDPE